MKGIVLGAVLLMAASLALPPARAVAQCDPDCPADSDGNHRITVDEIVANVNLALGACGDPERQGCLDSGGTVSTSTCCSTAPDFPDTCKIGGCGCSPQFSRELPLCDCGDGKCYDRDQHACVAR